MECVDSHVIQNGNPSFNNESGLDSTNGTPSPTHNAHTNGTPSPTHNVNNAKSNLIAGNGVLPQLLIDECSPNKWEPQIVEFISNVSVQTTPGASTDKSQTNSYVTAKDKLISPPSLSFSFGNGNESNFVTDLSESHNATVSSVNQQLDNSFLSNNSVENNKRVLDHGSTPSDSSVYVTLPSAPSSTSTPFSSNNSVENKMSFDNGSTPSDSSAYVTSPSALSSINKSSLNGLTSPPDDLSRTPSMNSFQRESNETFGTTDDEDYFEEYHLPNTHENTFVRHQSFRRKVQTIPIHAPDAERIEGLVRTGEFIRHGSIRRKILPEEEVLEEYEEEEENNNYNEGEDRDSSSFTERIERDIHEIERRLSEDNSKAYPSLAQSTPGIIKHLKRTASTPKTSSESDADNCKGDLSTETEIQPPSEIFEENVSIEASTLQKIQDCLDFSTYKDILNLSGRLSDLLSPKEVEEVLNNSERYRQYLNSEVFEALSLSYHEQSSQSLPFTVNLKSTGLISNNTKSNSSSDKSVPNPDSGFSSPKSPKAQEDATSIPKSHSQNELHLVERSSAACNGIGAPGIFVESVGSTTDLRKIPAPSVNLDWSSESKFEDGDLDISEGNLETSPPRKRISVSTDVLNLSGYQDEIESASEAIERDNQRLGQSRDAQTILGRDEISPRAIGLVAPPPDLIPELTAAEEMSEVRHWRNVVIGGAWRRIDMKAIAPFRKCISHGGYMEDESQLPIVVISAALLPDKARKDYDYVMDNLFMYVLSIVEQLASDDYVMIYFSGGKLNGSGPGFHWMRRAYEMIDRRLRKNLKSLLIVHPSLWSRTILTLSRPFISSKFYRKLKFVHTLTDLAMMVPLEQLEIPDAVKQADFQIMIKEKKKIMNR